VPQSWFDNLNDLSKDMSEVFDEWWLPDLDSIGSGAVPVNCPQAFYQPEAHTLLMGDLNPVVASQLAHERCLDLHDVAPLAGNLGHDVWFPRGRLFRRSGADVSDPSDVLFGIYIDDLCAIAFVSWRMLRGNVHGKFVSKHEGFVSEGQLLTRRADAAYAAEGWPRSTKKDQNDEPTGKMWGSDLLGAEGVAGINREKRCGLSALTLKHLNAPLTYRQKAGI
jgi:hypothetical protein